jgi:outer membrane receptor protein involved in Fe transport
MKHPHRPLALLATLAGLSVGFAQESTEVPTLPTTVVTGELWESELQNTTASISVLDADALEDKGVQHFEDVINAIPNLTWTGGTSRPRYIQIRGIGENSQFEGETPDSAVRFLIDDLDFTGIGTVGNLFDVQQVEVLRGPQAGAFGANAAGGMVRIVTNDPTPYWTGQAEATVGNDDLRAAGIAVGGPLSESDPEQLTFRLALHKLVQDGFRENVFLDKDDTNERDELTTRLKLRWQPSQDWQIDGQLFYADIDNGFDEFTLNNSRTKTFSDEPGRDEQESLGLSVKATWTARAVEIVSTANYIDTDSLYSFDGDWSDADNVTFPNPTPPPAFDDYSSFLELNRSREVYSEDLRLNSIAKRDALGWIDRWTVGFYYEFFEEGTDTTGFGTFQTNYNSKTYSLYGQGTHFFSERTRLTLGLRAEHYDLKTQMDFREDVGFNDLLIGGKLTLEHELNTAQTIFASITRGYKAGGANIYPFLDTSILPGEYDTEKLWNYEIGLRSEWFDGQMTSKLTLFYLDRCDAQLRDSAGTGIDFTYFTVNGQEAKHYGLEAETTWFFAEDWSLNLAGGLLDTNRAAYRDPGDPINSISERELSNAPNYTYSASLNYSPAQGIFASAEIVGSDDYFESNSHSENRDAYTVLNAAIGYRIDNWTFTLWTKNLLDEKYADRVFFFANEAPDFASEQRYEASAAPRTLGITANYRW